MDLVLYKVGASGRVALGDLADGVEYYTIERNYAAGTNVLTLTPVTIVSGTAKGTALPAQDPEPDSPTEVDPDNPPFV